MTNWREVGGIVTNEKLGTQYLAVNLAATWDGIFPLKRINALSGQKVFLNVISSVFTPAKA